MIALTAHQFYDDFPGPVCSLFVPQRTCLPSWLSYNVGYMHALAIAHVSQSLQKVFLLSCVYVWPVFGRRSLFPKGCRIPQPVTEGASFRGHCQLEKKNGTPITWARQVVNNKEMKRNTGLQIDLEREDEKNMSPRSCAGDEMLVKALANKTLCKQISLHRCHKLV